MVKVKVKKRLYKYNDSATIFREFLDPVTKERIDGIFIETSRTRFGHFDSTVKTNKSEANLFVTEKDILEKHDKVVEFFKKNFGDLHEVVLKYIKKDIESLKTLTFDPIREGNEIHKRLEELGEHVVSDESCGFSHAYVFSCGCIRTYSVSPFSMKSAESLNPCEKHKNLQAEVFA